LLLAIYFDELARKRRKDAAPPSAGKLHATSPNEVVVTEEEVDEDE
jgi:hypothetical protein